MGRSSGVADACQPGGAHTRTKSRRALLCLRGADAEERHARSDQQTTGCIRGGVKTVRSGYWVTRSSSWTVASPLTPSSNAIPRLPQTVRQFERRVGGQAERWLDANALSRRTPDVRLPRAFGQARTRSPSALGTVTNAFAHVSIRALFFP